MLSSTQILALKVGDVLVNGNKTVVISQILSQKVSPTSGKAFILFRDEGLSLLAIREGTPDAQNYKIYQS